MLVLQGDNARMLGLSTGTPDQMQDSKKPDTRPENTDPYVVLSCVPYIIFPVLSFDFLLIVLSCLVIVLSFLALYCFVLLLSCIHAHSLFIFSDGESSKLCQHSETYP